MTDLAHDERQRVAGVARAFGLGVSSVCRAEGGFSGARVYRVMADGGNEYAFRRWPDGTDASRIGALHRIVAALREHDFSFLARPLLCSADGGKRLSLFTSGRSPDQALWHVETWQPGCADFQEQPSVLRAQRVGTAIGLLHRALAGMSDVNRWFRPTRGGPQSVIERHQLAVRWIAKLRHQPTVPGPLRPVVASIERDLPLMERRLANAMETTHARLPICLRDLWHDSVLWSGEQITGLIDLAAARVDHPMGDVARLFGSLFAGKRDPLKQQLWSAGLDAYAAVRPLSAEDHQLLSLYGDSETVLSILGWIERLHWADHPPPDALAAQARLDHFLTRYEIRT